jgi:hypothetical protein
MKDNNKQRVELPLTEEEYEKASAEMQIRSDFQENLLDEIVHRPDVTKILTLRAGKEPKSTDTRRPIELYETPTQFFYFTRPEYTCLNRDLGYEGLLATFIYEGFFVDNAKGKIQFAMQYEDCSLEEAYDITVSEDKQHIKEKIVSALEEEFNQNTYQTEQDEDDE